MNEGVCVILDAPDGDRMRVMGFCDARHVRPQFRLEGFRDYLEAIFRAKHHVDVVADVRAGHCVVPSGLNSQTSTYPALTCRTTRHPALTCRAKDCA
jgi:hypothetical protein